MQRTAVKPFNDKQIALLQTFADQAVIAIESTRLFQELQARTRELSRSVAELKALGEVGHTISSTLDLKAVLNAILIHACRLADSGGGAIYVFDAARGEFDLEAGYNMGEDLVTAVRKRPIRFGETLVGECAERREAVQIEKMTEVPPHPLFEMHIKAGVRALLGVPLLHQDEVVGALVVRRKRAGAFPSRSSTCYRPRIPVEPGDLQRPPVPRDRAEEPRARDRQPAQVAVRRQHEPPAENPTGRHPRLCRADAGGLPRPAARKGQSDAGARASERQAPVGADQQRTRHLQDRSRPIQPQPRRVCARRHGRDGAGGDRFLGGGEDTGAHDRGRQ